MVCDLETDAALIPNKKVCKEFIRAVTTSKHTETAKLNAERFIGFADIYENSRPEFPSYAIDIIIRYIRRIPQTVVDLGCGTGLSTLVWENKCEKIIGIDPSDDMLSIAKTKSNINISFIKAYSDNTGLPDDSADVVFCSQSFHWMNPRDTLKEINRILKNGGIFAVIDYDWPPVCNVDAEIAYMDLFNKVRIIEEKHKKICETFHRWDKNNHLKNMIESGYFRYCREIVFDNCEDCSAERFLALAQSQGSLQTIIKHAPELIEKDYFTFQKAIYKISDKAMNKACFCYRMRIGIK